MENWKPIKDFPGYEVSDKGNIRNAKTGKLLSTKHQDRGRLYCMVTMKCNGGYITKTVHRIVAEAFIPNPGGGTQVHHKNRDKSDNRVDNLEWVTPAVHSKLDARPKRETAYYRNKEAREEKRKMS